MRWRRRFPLVLLAAMALLAASCGGGGGEEPAAPAEGGGEAIEFDDVTLASVNNMMHLPEYVAVENGFFAENGLNAQLDILTSGADINKAMQSGNAEFGGISNTAASAARSAGLNVKLVVPVMGDPTTESYAGPLGIIGRADRGVVDGDPKSLIGKRVAVHEGSTNHEYFNRVLATNGIDPSQVEVVPITAADQPVSLRQGDVDAASDWEPFVSQMVAELGDNAVVVSRAEPVIGYTIGITSPDEVISGKREVIKKFAAAIAQSSHWVRQNPEEASQAALSFIDGLGEEHALAAMDHLAFDPRVSGCTLRAYERTSEILAERGEITTPSKATDLVDPTIMAEVEEEHPEWFEDLPPIPEECQ